MSDIIFQKMDRKHLNKMQVLKSETYTQTHALFLNNYDDQLRWFDSLQNDKTKLFLIANKGDDEIGTFKLDNIDWVNRHCNVGWDIFKEFRGLGLGKPLVKSGVDFCFRILNLHRLNCEILITNLASLKCAEYAGFEIEGTKKQCVYKNGEWIDTYFMGILKDNE